MPRTAYAVRHVAFEDLGIFEDLLTERGFSVEYRDAGIDALNTPEVREADLLIILGAPISVNDTQDYPFLFEEVELIKARITSQKPVLGICLGAQQIALAAGAQVDPTGEIELGYSPVELTEAGEESVLAPLGNTPSSTGTEMPSPYPRAPQAWHAPRCARTRLLPSKTKQGGPTHWHSSSTLKSIPAILSSG